TDSGQDAAPGGDTSFLFGGVEEHERGGGDFAHHRERVLVGVVDHARPRGRVLVLTQPRLVSGQGEGSGGAWGDDATPVEELSDGGAVDPPAGHGHPLDDRPSRDRYPGEEDGGDPDGGGVGQPHPAASVQGGDDGGDRDPDGDQLGRGQAQQDAAPGQPGELHRHQLRTGRIRFVAAVLVAAAQACGSFPALDGGGGLSAGGGFGTGADGDTCSPPPGEDDPGGCELGVLGGVGSALAGGVP